MFTTELRTLLISNRASRVFLLPLRNNTACEISRSESPTAKYENYPPLRSLNLVNIRSKDLHSSSAAEPRNHFRQNRAAFSVEYACPTHDYFVFISLVT